MKGATVLVDQHIGCLDLDIQPRDFSGFGALPVLVCEGNHLAVVSEMMGRLSSLVHGAITFLDEWCCPWVFR
ncbi:hypothetical protein D3C85_1890640 [compost metagenome]